MSDIRTYLVTIRTQHAGTCSDYDVHVRAYTAADAITQVKLSSECEHPRPLIVGVRPKETDS